MFENCKSLTSLNITNFNTEVTIDMRGMFKGCTGLTELDLTSFNTKAINSLNDIFGDIVYLKVKVIEENVAKLIEKYEFESNIEFVYI